MMKERAMKAQLTDKPEQGDGDNSKRSSLAFIPDRNRITLNINKLPNVLHTDMKASISQV